MKNLKIFASALAIAMLSFTACDDNTTPVEPDTNEESTLCETCGKNPCECTADAAPAELCELCGKNPCECEKEPESQEPENTYPIQIDGEYDDWAALDPAKVVETTCSEAAKYNVLTTVKVWADEMFINVYMEFIEDSLDLSMVPVHVYFNVDNSESTAPHQWINQGGVDVILEGKIYSEGSPYSYDPTLYSYTGEEDLWSWTMESVFPSNSNFGSGAGGDGKYEFSLLKDMIPGEFADVFGIGFDIQTSSWSSIGILPNDVVTDDNPEGRAPLLLVAIDKE